jgi:hypothetical protein
MTLLDWLPWIGLALLAAGVMVGAAISRDDDAGG